MTETRPGFPGHQPAPRDTMPRGRKSEVVASQLSRVLALENLEAFFVAHRSLRRRGMRSIRALRGLLSRRRRLLRGPSRRLHPHVDGLAPALNRRRRGLRDVGGAENANRLDLPVAERVLHRLRVDGDALADPRRGLAAEHDLDVL